MRQDYAETVAVQALAWITQHEDVFPVFLTATGCGADDIRSRVDDPDLLGSVLDFVALEDGWVLAFCDTAGLSHAEFREARAQLSGGRDVHWT